MSSGSQNPYEAPLTYSEARPEFELDKPLELASPLTRLGARLVDGFISLLILVPVMLATGYLHRAMNQQVRIGEMAIYTIGGFALYLGLHGYFLATRGQTIGKMLVGVRIVDYRSGRLLPLVKLFGLRDLPLGLVACIPCVGGIVNLVNILFIFGSEQRCLHDLIAGTKVVKA